MQAVNILIINYLVILVINAAMAIFCLFYYKEKIYKTVLYFWCATFTTLVLQGVFQVGNVPMSLAFSSSFLVVVFELKILAEASRLTFSLKSYAGIAVLSIGLTIFLGYLKCGFTIVALPVAIGVASVLLHASLRALSRAAESSDPPGVSIFSVILVIHAIHVLDYPFLRQDQNFAALGFSIALILLVSYSIFIPSFILNNISHAYLKTISELNAKHTAAHQQIKELISLAHVGEMSFGFIHDMAAPIQILNHYSVALHELQLEGRPNKQQIDSYSKGIDNATQTVASLQRMFRSFLQNGTSKEVTDVEIKKTISDCVELFQPIALKAKIQLTSEFYASPTVITSHKGVVDRILLNLIQNAINALFNSKRKEICISVEDVENNQIAIVVRDSGPGISEERRVSLWEKFGHSETAKDESTSRTKVTVGGSGFGLFQVKTLVEEIHGTIQLIDTSKNGTAFQIILPRKFPITE
jgi:signal transduction histidine kinase